MRDRLDVHAALGRGDHGDAAHLSVDQHGDVELALDVAALLDVEALHGLAGGSGLLGDQLMAQHRLRAGTHVLDRFHDADAALAVGIVLEAAGAASAGMDLGLDHGDGRPELAGHVHRLVLGVGDPALEQGDGEFGQQSLGLILVDVHEILSLADQQKACNS
jgi:hypothetical protein